MKCPCCGCEMTLDGHRRMDMYMCYECGYIEGRRIELDVSEPSTTNFEKLHNMNLNELAAFVANRFGLDNNTVALWLEHRAVA